MKTHTSTFLRRALLLDAVGSGAVAAAALLLTSTLAGLLSLPMDLLREAGLVLIPFTAFVAWLATQEHPWRAGVWAVIAINAVWVVESIVLLLSGSVAPNALGYAFVIAQAIAVGVFAELEYIGLRKSVIVRA